VSKSYIIKTKRGYVAVVEGGQEKEITEKQAVAEIKRLIKIRHKAGRDLSKLIRHRGVTAASINNATSTVGAGE
jgi:hypothetical protein